ncbi:MAG: zinc ribbon domain-containing protein [Candidatus Aminicenantes bacterium]
MPIYSYRCSDCEEQFDLLVGVTSEKAELKCQKCGSTNIKRILTAFSVHANTSESSCSTGTCMPVSCPTCK